jgi:hypothetical protein
MAAATTDLLRKTGASTVTTLAAPGKALSATSITVGSTTNYPTDTGIVIAIRVVDTAGVLVAGTYSEYNAIVASGTSFTITAVPAYGSDQVYAAGSTTQVFIPVSAKAHNDLIDGILVHANQDGSLKKTAIDLALGSASGNNEGWSASAGTHSVGTGYNSGNRSFEIDTASDLSGTVSPGMRYKVNRNTPPPTQCADLEASSSQYASKTSPTGIVFTTTYSAEAWVQLESYGSNMGIVSRFNGTNGWRMFLLSDGTIYADGYNGTALDRIESYQSIPLNKKVHIAVALTMNTSGSSAIYIDGVLVPTKFTNGGATTISQAGDLQVGAYSSGSTFDGKLSDVRVWSDIRTATEIQDNMFGYPADTTGLVAHFKLAGDFTDSSSNGNDLTASGGAVATDVDNPWNATEYGIITAVSATTIQVFCPTGYGIPNETLTAPFYSTQAVPFGFPRDKGLWRVSFRLRTTISTASNATFAAMTGMSFSVPVGAWIVGYTAGLNVTAVVALFFNLNDVAQTGLSSTSSDLSMQSVLYGTSGSASNSTMAIVSRPRSLTSATTFTMYSLGSTTTGQLQGPITLTEFFAECAYI